MEHLTLNTNETRVLLSASSLLLCPSASCVLVLPVSCILCPPALNDSNKQSEHRKSQMLLILPDFG